MERIPRRQRKISDTYAEPANFLEIEITDPETIGSGSGRYTEYTMSMRTNLPVFKIRDISVKRRYSDFEWLRNELARDSKIIVRRWFIKKTSLFIERFKNNILPLF